MKQGVLTLLLFVIFQISVFCQFQIAKEEITAKPKEIVDSDSIIKYIIGIDGNQLIFSLDYINKDCYETKALAYYDESNKKVSNKEKIPFNEHFGLISAKKTNELSLYSIFQKKLHDNHSFCDILDLQNLNVEYSVNINNNTFLLNNKNSFEVEVYIQLSYDGRYVVYTPYLGEYLRDSKNDTIITIYDFQEKGREIPIITELTCKECIKPQITNEQLFYGKKFNYFPGTDEYDWKIFRAPMFDLQKSELLAEYIEILLVSPDGKYILGKKNLQGRYVAVLLDVEAKRFDYLLGRDYLQYDYFFSPAYKKFAFDTKNQIIYINYPDKFPFKSVGEEAKRIQTSKSEKAEFWEKYKYKTL